MDEDEALKTFGHAPSGELSPIARLIRDELIERGWTVADLAVRMGGATIKEIELDRLSIEFLLAGDDEPRMLIGEDGARKLGLAFGTSTELWLNLERRWRERRATNTALVEEKDRG